MSIAYPIRHWLTSVILAPTLVLLYVIGQFKEFGLWAFAAYLFFVLVGLLLSLPVFLVYLMVYKELIKRKMPAWVIKLILNVIALSGVGIIFLLMHDFGSMAKDLSICYAVVVVGTSFIFRLKREETEVEELR